LVRPRDGARLRLDIVPGRAVTGLPEVGEPLLVEKVELAERLSGGVGGDIGAIRGLGAGVMEAIGGALAGPGAM
jgi:hypothetical protein